MFPLQWSTRGAFFTVDPLVRFATHLENLRPDRPQEDAASDEVGNVAAGLSQRQHTGVQCTFSMSLLEQRPAVGTGAVPSVQECCVTTGFREWAEDFISTSIHANARKKKEGLVEVCVLCHGNNADARTDAEKCWEIRNQMGSPIDLMEGQGASLGWYFLHTQAALRQEFGNSCGFMNRFPDTFQTVDEMVDKLRMRGTSSQFLESLHRAPNDHECSVPAASALLCMRKGTVSARALAAHRNLAVSVDHRPPTSAARTTERVRPRSPESSGYTRSFLLHAVQSSTIMNSSPSDCSAVAVERRHQCGVNE